MNGISRSSLHSRLLPSKLNANWLERIVILLYQNEDNLWVRVILQLCCTQMAEKAYLLSRNAATISDQLCFSLREMVFPVYYYTCKSDILKFTPNLTLGFCIGQESTSY